MSVASPYAVFRAAELGWPPRPLVGTAPAIVLPAPVASHPSRKRSKRPGASVASWNATIQGELFQAA